MAGRPWFPKIDLGTEARVGITVESDPNRGEAQIDSVEGRDVAAQDLG